MNSPRVESGEIETDDKEGRSHFFNSALLQSRDGIVSILDLSTSNAGAKLDLLLRRDTGHLVGHLGRLFVDVDVDDDLPVAFEHPECSISIVLLENRDQLLEPLDVEVVGELPDRSVSSDEFRCEAKGGMGGGELGVAVRGAGQSGGYGFDGSERGADDHGLEAIELVFEVFDGGVLLERKVEKARRRSATCLSF